MFVLISMPPKMDPLGRASIIDILKPSMDECVLGVFTTKELAVQGISAYTGTPHAGKTAVIYEMLPDGDKQKRVKIYEGSFPLRAPKLSNDVKHKQSSTAHLNGYIKIMNKHIQRLEEKLEAKGAECNRLKNDNTELVALIDRMKVLIQV